MTDYLCRPEALERFVARIFAGEGLPQADAEVVAASLVHANLRGVDSHGVTRIPIYVDRLRRGLVAARPTVELVRDAGGVLLFDGGGGMGAVVTMRALDEALARLPDRGALSVGIRRSTHYGTGAFYAEHAVQHGAAVFLYSNAPSTMAPWGGVERHIGTNPYTFAVPLGDRDPLVLDMATSVVARGKIILAAQRGESIPDVWALDPEGNRTTDAEAALEGSVLPFGGPKGYGIALMIDVMAGVLTGAAFGRGIGDLYEELGRPQDVGAFVQLVDIAAFMPPEVFAQRVTTYVDELKGSRKAAGVDEILVPGEFESATARRRRREGLSLSAQLVDQLRALGADSAAMLDEALEPVAQNPQQGESP